MKYYCPKCFNKIEYKFNKPEKCPKCSLSFASVSANSTSTQGIKLEDDLREIERKKIEKRIQLAESLQAKRVLDNESGYNEEDIEAEFDTNYEWRPGMSKLRKNPGIHIEIKKQQGVSLASVLQDQNGNKNNDFKDWKRQPNHLTKEQILEEIRKESSGPASVINID